MEKTKFYAGMENLKKSDGKGGEAVIRTLKTISPDLGRYIVEFAIGDIYKQNDLSLQKWKMLTSASLLTAGGCEPQLKVHINGALNVGIAPEKIIKIFGLSTLF
ncbi:MAG: carboxymuconolactone decarboxylase family protein [Lachnospiraceae bacterium]|nr:carboxymuconolactone decarboxylase family protein [Lachnospiraceae bacterium]